MCRLAGFTLLLLACESPAAAPDASSGSTEDGRTPLHVPSPLIESSCVGTGGPRVLVYMGENLWTHTGNPAAARAILGMCASRGFSVFASRDPYIFDHLDLMQIDTLVFAATSGPVLHEQHRTALESWMRDGGGLVGLHTADATESMWPYFVDAIGATLKTHAPGVYPAEFTIEDPEHPIVQGMPLRWPQTDEIHVFNSRPEETAMTILMAVDEATLPASYGEEFKVGYHPVAWAHELYGGRVFYSCLGHGAETYEDPAYVELVARAIEWTARR